MRPSCLRVTKHFLVLWLGMTRIASRAGIAQKFTSVAGADALRSVQAWEVSVEMRTSLRCGALCGRCSNCEGFAVWAVDPNKCRLVMSTTPANCSSGVAFNDIAPFEILGDWFYFMGVNYYETFWPITETITLPRRATSSAPPDGKCGSILEYYKDTKTGWTLCYLAAADSYRDTPCSDMLRGPNLNGYDSAAEFGAGRVQYGCWAISGGVETVNPVEVCVDGLNHNLTLSNCSTCNMAVCIRYA